MARFHLHKSYLLLLGAAVLSSAVCCELLFDTNRQITIMSYNVQNLFDDVDDGTEYAEFDPGSGGWTDVHYHGRLSAISEVIQRALPRGPDILALQEVESLRALTALQEDYLRGMGYVEAVLVPAPGAAVQTAVLSRFPLTDIRCHLPVASERGRYIQELTFSCRGHELLLINNHWKSKSGGAFVTEEQRRWAAVTISGIIAEKLGDNPGLDILVVGDLNESHDEYERVEGAYETALRPNTLAAGPDDGALYLTDDPAAAGYHDGRVVLFSPWYDYRGPGSYVWDGKWETIDHALLSAGLFDREGLWFEGFTVVSRDFMLTSRGYPRGWSRETMRGYSDHLPLLVTLGVE
ncbi:MAG: endonuclease/exonuclease/phosphatase family protein [Spirochaetales bacterium]|nr:endonuclease/exonuclease/phosphatase family protein [Spirochaetales bacterium]